MIASLLALIYSLVFHAGDWPLIIVIGILTIFIFYRHRANIKRIINKTEPKVKWL
jgi:glycerol-3-phosphate acyltransferase PlsY